MSDGLIAVLALFLLLLAVLWIILPFAVFGLKARAERTNELLAEIRDALKARPDLPSVAEIVAKRQAGDPRS